MPRRPAVPKNRPHNPRRLTELGALRVLDENAWDEKIRSAVLACGGNITRAAAHLGISSRQMFRIIADRRFAGLERTFGRPRSE